MTITSRPLSRAQCSPARRFPGRGDAAWLAMLAALLLGSADARGADAGEAAAASKNPVMRLERIEGSAAKRVILSARAAERLGIATGTVTEEAVSLKQIVGGLVVPPPDAQAAPKPPAGSFGGFGGFGKVAAAAEAPPVAPQAPTGPVAAQPVVGDAWVQVTLSAAEWERLDKEKPARLLPLATRDKPAGEIWAEPSGMAPVEDVKRTMLSAYYVVRGNEAGLKLNHRMRVELPLAGSEAVRKVVPYSAIQYDAKGTAWVYVNPSPLTFERLRVDVERVVGERAVLVTGPPPGTRVVVVGAPLLYGAEVFGK